MHEQTGGRISVRLRRSAGALNRLGDSVRSLGFEIQRLVARVSEDEDWFDVTLTLSGAFPLEVLEHRLGAMLEGPADRVQSA